MDIPFQLCLHLTLDLQISMVIKQMHFAPNCIFWLNIILRLNSNCFPALTFHFNEDTMQFEYFNIISMNITLISGSVLTQSAKQKLQNNKT